MKTKLTLIKSPPLEIRPGKYLLRDGTCDRIYNLGGDYAYGSRGTYWIKNGRWAESASDSSFDLVERLGELDTDY